MQNFRQGMIRIVCCGVLALVIAGCAVHDAIKEGDRALRRDDPVAAARFYEQALSLRPTLGEKAEFAEKLRVARRDAALEQGRSLLRQERWDAAIAKLEASLAIEPGYAPAERALAAANAGAGEAAFGEAVAAADAGDLDAARAAVQTALGHAPEHAAAREALASLDDPRLAKIGRETEARLIEEKRWDLAAAALPAVVTANPNHLAARALRAQAAAAVARRDALVSEAREALQGRAIDAAIAALDQATTLAPHDEEAARLLGEARELRRRAEALVAQSRAATEARRWDDAIRLAGEAKAIFPAMPEAIEAGDTARATAAGHFTAEGDAALRADDRPAATRAYRAALSYRDGHEPATLGLAAVATAYGDDAAADGRWGLGLLRYLDAHALASNEQTRAEVRRAEAHVIDRAAAFVAPASIPGRGADALQLEDRLFDALRRTAPEALRVIEGEKVDRAPYRVAVSSAEVRIDEDLVSEVGHVHPYEVRTVHPNPEIPRLERKLRHLRHEARRLEAQYHRELAAYQKAKAAWDKDPENRDKAVRQKALGRRAKDTRREHDAVEDQIDRVEHDLRFAPELVEVATRASWPYTVETYRKTAELAARVTVTDPVTDAALPAVAVDEDVADEDETIDRPNPEIGLRGDGLSLPSDASMRHSLLDAGAAGAAKQVISRVLTAQLARIVERAEGEQDASAALEAWVDAAVLQGAIDPSGSRRELDRLRRETPPEEAVATPTRA